MAEKGVAAATDRGLSERREEESSWIKEWNLLETTEQRPKALTSPMLLTMRRRIESGSLCLDGRISLITEKFKVLTDEEENVVGEREIDAVNEKDKDVVFDVEKSCSLCSCFEQKLRSGEKCFEIKELAKDSLCEASREKGDFSRVREIPQERDNYSTSATQGEYPPDIQCKDKFLMQMVMDKARKPSL
ncbi:unnamed protein product [Arabidopsis lyrata]|uniref:Predicted protein n=1 Tax=Arabidopsis lyrata subsp. lyrata TaxID=81972 RepID=D7MPW6_ARALL|nr:predicted protein [Arabidopsis lyrata subsp. lyrata]CAH8277979.1 unnamed protein product [Arabidopsis lyrata]